MRQPQTGVRFVPLSSGAARLLRKLGRMAELHRLAATLLDQAGPMLASFLSRHDHDDAADEAREYRAFAQDKALDAFENLSPGEREQLLAVLQTKYGGQGVSFDVCPPPGGTGRVHGQCGRGTCAACNEPRRTPEQEAAVVAEIARIAAEEKRAQEQHRAEGHTCDPYMAPEVRVVQCEACAKRAAAFRSMS